MNSHVWIYFSKTGVGYELTGTDVISGFDAFVHSDGTYLIEYSYSDLGQLVKNAQQDDVLEYKDSLIEFIRIRTY